MKKQVLIDANLLSRISNWLDNNADHWCDDEDCTIDNPQCNDMEVLALKKELDDCLEPPMASLHPERLSSTYERIYYEKWAALNKKQPGINNGRSTLEYILTPSGHSPQPVTSREAEVATAVIQWLGTNCGHGFLCECERVIQEETKVDRELEYIIGIVPDRPQDFFNKLLNKSLNSIIHSSISDLPTIKRLKKDMTAIVKVMFSAFCYQSGLATIDESVGADEDRQKKFIIFCDKLKVAATDRIKKLRERMVRRLVT